MGTRTVSVDLQLKAAGFVAGAKEAEKATNSLNDELDDVAKHGKDFDAAVADTDKLTAAAKETAREVDKAGEQMKEAGVDADGLAVAAKEAARVTDTLGTQMKESGVDARFLAGELSKARDKALELAAAFTLTGDRADLAAYKKQARYVSDLERLLKAVTPAAGGGGGAGGGPDVAKSAAALGSSAGQSFGEAFKAAGPLKAIGQLFADPIIGIPLLVGATLIGAEVGGVLGGAIVTGIGAAGIGAGVAAALSDSRIRSIAKSEFGEVFSGIVDDARQAFAVPTVAALHEISGAFTTLRPELRATASELAPLTQQLGHGIAQGVDEFGSHLTRALVNSKPLIEWAANEIPVVLDEVGGLLENLSEHADEERFALNAFFGAVEIVIKALEVLADVGSAVIYPLQKVHDLVLGAPKAHKDAADATKDNAHAVEELAAAAISAVPSLSDLQKQLHQTSLTADMLAGEMVDKVFDSLVSADRATLGLAESQARLSDSLKQNGKDFRFTTDAGRANREAVLQSLDANRRMYDTMIQGGVSAQDAAKAYDQNTDALERQLQKAHVAQGTIDQLIGKYRQVPDDVDTDISMHGLAGAIDDLNDLLRMLNGLPSRKTIVIEERHHVTGQSTPQRWGGVHYAADGVLNLSQAATYHGGPLYGFAEPETGGEAFVPRYGDHGRSTRILSEAAGWYGLAVGRPAPMQGGGGGPSTLQLAATFVLPSGEVVHKQLITYALNTGRQPAALFPAASR